MDILRWRGRFLCFLLSRLEVAKIVQIYAATMEKYRYQFIMYISWWETRQHFYGILQLWGVVAGSLRIRPIFGEQIRKTRVWNGKGLTRQLAK